MNILIAATHITRANGGVSTHIIDLCKGLLLKKHNIAVVSSGGEYVENIKKLGIKHYEIPFIGIQNHPFEMIKALWKLRKIIKENNIELVHTHGQSTIPFFQIIRKIDNIPFVWTNHIDAVAQPNLFKKIYNFSPFPIISVSLDLKKYLKDEFNITKNVRVIHNGINTQDYKELTEIEKSKYRELFQINKNQFVICLPGRLTYGKGHKYLIEAVAELSKVYQNKKFVILIAGGINRDGEKEYLDEIFAYASDKNVNLNYIGFQNLRNVFGICNLVCLPSIYEGFGIVCAEAFAMKIPVIRSDTPGATDMKDICLVFHKKDVQELTDKIKYVIDNPDKVAFMIKHAFDKVNNEYTKEVMAEKTIEVYESISHANGG